MAFQLQCAWHHQLGALQYHLMWHYLCLLGQVMWKVNHLAPAQHYTQRAVLLDLAQQSRVATLPKQASIEMLLQSNFLYQVSYYHYGPLVKCQSAFLNACYSMFYCLLAYLAQGHNLNPPKDDNVRYV